MIERIKNEKKWPENLRVIPLSYQDAAQLVSLEMECDTITRSGGATAMELLVLNQAFKKQGIASKKRLIHAQPVEGRSLEDSIPLWEKGNYQFLRDAIGNNIVDAVDPSSLKL